jgi:hypothetical protein
MTAKLAVSYFFTTWSGPSGACARVDRKTRVTIQREREALGNSFAACRILTRHFFRHLGNCRAYTLSFCRRRVGVRLLEIRVYAQEIVATDL